MDPDVSMLPVVQPAWSMDPATKENVSAVMVGMEGKYLSICSKYLSFL